MDSNIKVLPAVDEPGLPRITNEEPQILEEIEIEELSIDGICGVY